MKVSSNYRQINIQNIVKLKKLKKLLILIHTNDII